MRTSNLCFYKELHVDKSTHAVILLDCALIWVWAVIRGNTVCQNTSRPCFKLCLSFAFITACIHIIWAVTSENVPLDMCAQRRFRSVCASAQSDLNLYWAHWIARDATFVHADNDDFEETARMRRLIWVFVWRKCKKAFFLTFPLIYSRYPNWKKKKKNRTFH